MMKKFLVSIAVASAFAVTSANAGFLILDDATVAPAGKSDDKPSAKNATAASVAAPADVAAPFVASGTIKVGGLRMIGGSRNDSIINKGERPSKIGGKTDVTGSMTLEDAIAQLIPDDFTVYAAEGVDITQNVNVQPGKDWSAAVGKALIPTRYVAAIDWASKEVVVAVDGSIKTKAQNAAKIFDQPTVAPSAVVLNDADPVKAEPAAAYSRPKQWRVLKTDGLLSETVNRWCKESATFVEGACTKVSWESSNDLSIEGEATFSGQFNDVIAGLFGAVAETSRHTFRHVMHSNGILIITDGDGKK